MIFLNYQHFVIDHFIFYITKIVSKTFDIINIHSSSSHFAGYMPTVVCSSPLRSSFTFLRLLSLECRLSIILQDVLCFYSYFLTTTRLSLYSICHHHASRYDPLSIILALLPNLLRFGIQL